MSSSLLSTAIGLIIIMLIFQSYHDFHKGTILPRAIFIIARLLSEAVSSLILICKERQLRIL